MLNSVQLLGCLLIGGLISGEIVRRVIDLPRTTGFVLFGLAVWTSGLGWVQPQDIESARLFVDLALGLILFELGHRFSAPGWRIVRGRLRAGLVESVFSGLLMFVTAAALGFSPVIAAFAAAIGISTSPAITIATSSDVGAKGRKSEILFTLVALNGTVAFVLLTFISGISGTGGWWQCAHRSLEPIFFSVLIGLAGALLAVQGAKRLGRYVEHQHLLLLGLIVVAVGTALALEISVLLPLLILGVGTRILDRSNEVVTIRISSDARIFLVITFVLAGASLDVGLLSKYWGEALVFVSIRLAGKFVALQVMHRYLGLDEDDVGPMVIGLMPMSSVAIVLVTDMRMQETQGFTEVYGMLMTAILLMQLLGPVATQYAIKRFGEATLFMRGEKMSSASSV